MSQTEPSVRTYHFNPIRLFFWGACCTWVTAIAWIDASNAGSILNWFGVGIDSVLAASMTLRLATIPFHRAWLTESELEVRESSILHPWLRTRRVPIGAIRVLWTTQTQYASNSHRCAILYVDPTGGKTEPRVVRVGDTLWNVWGLLARLNERTRDQRLAFRLHRIDSGKPVRFGPIVVTAATVAWDRRSFPRYWDRRSYPIGAGMKVRAFDHRLRISGGLSPSTTWQQSEVPEWDVLIPLIEHLLTRMENGAVVITPYVGNVGVPRHATAEGW